MSSPDQKHASEINALLDDVFGCPCNCALALWSMPEPEAIRWECPVATRGQRHYQCPEKREDRAEEEP